MATVLGLITARGGSKGVPRKNVRTVARKPLIAWTIESARQSRRLDRIVVSTDDDEIASVSRQFGAVVPFMRPPELARDDSPHIDVVLHALRWLAQEEKYEPEYVLLLQPTSPLRTAEDIDGMIDLALERRAEAVVSVSPACDHPYLAKRVDSEGVIAPFMECPLAYARRQDLPPAYALNGALYLQQCAGLLKRQSFEGCRTIAYIMPRQRSLEVDTEADLIEVERILTSSYANPSEQY
jgi:CMP-N-acetylneuraminic acid synthetase